MERLDRPVEDDAFAAREPDPHPAPEHFEAEVAGARVVRLEGEHLPEPTAPGILEHDVPASLQLQVLQ
ncbi:hypothetical protein ACWEOW_23295 [Monashia sp. NPDC004114]